MDPIDQGHAAMETYLARIALRMHFIRLLALESCSQLQAEEKAASVSNMVKTAAVTQMLAYMADPVNPHVVLAEEAMIESIGPEHRETIMKAALRNPNFIDFVKCLKGYLPNSTFNWEAYLVEDRPTSAARTGQMQTVTKRAKVDWTSVAASALPRCVQAPQRTSSVMGALPPLVLSNTQHTITHLDPNNAWAMGGNPVMTQGAVAQAPAPRLQTFQEYQHVTRPPQAQSTNPFAPDLDRGVACSRLRLIT